MIVIRRWAGPLITFLVFVGVVVILLVNIDTGTGERRPGARTPVLISRAAPPTADNARAKPADFREYPIGDGVVEENGIGVAAVWLPPVQMDGSAMGGSDLIHLEADVKALEKNPQGFALGEFIPYLKITYEITPAEGGPPVQKGELMPMVAVDGLHYGASVAMPKAGEFKLTYKIQPPSAGGLGRHSDPVTGVAPWWPPFEVHFDWDYPGPGPAAPAKSA